MSSMDKAAIGISIAIAAIGVGIALSGAALTPTETIPSAGQSITSGMMDDKMMGDDMMMGDDKMMGDQMMGDDKMMDDKMVDKANTGPQTHTVTVPSGSAVQGCEETNECYLPPNISIYVGDTVEWDNVDTAAHTVTAGSLSSGPTGEFDSSLLLAGGVYSFTFEEAGEYDYFCIVHPWMAGSVSVN
ncbi:MAG: hypothetical protein D9C04_00690 [Nitrosopumilus sp. B06]|nr:MAG: hypothetical protein D9C04_00690 [Nitrosopumilus sp. B06]